MDEDDKLTSEKIDELIAPLCDSLGLSFSKSEVIDEEFDIIDKVKQFMEMHHSEDITSEDICRHIGCSRSLVSHQFKSQTGMSLREYLTELRIADAKHLLEHSTLTVTEIAFAVGFSSSNYFTNVFKKYMKISPAAYKKSACQKLKANQKF